MSDIDFNPVQKTLAREVQAPGIGVHSGGDVLLRLLPAPADSGIVFVRTDLPGAPEIPVAPKSVRADQMQRMTTLGLDDPADARVGMVEHLLSACAGLGVTNLRAELNAFECPVFDGSAMPYVSQIREAGMEDQHAPAPTLYIDRPVILRKPNCDIVALPAERPRYTFFAEFRHAGMPDQQVTFDPLLDDYVTEIAPARTFCFWKDIEGLLKAGLIKGGTTANAIVLDNSTPVRPNDNNDPVHDPDFQWRLDNELARHKLLDLIGDIAVLGGIPCMAISARATGHAVHQEFVQLLKEHARPHATDPGTAAVI